MRLLKLDIHGQPILATDFRQESLPPYAILSHTWHTDDQEVTFEDIRNGTGNVKSGYEKVLFCGAQAHKDGIAYFWVDSCCIDKRNSVELSEAINSMFRWYQYAERCYVYLTDVSARKRDGHGDSTWTWQRAFRSSRWHRRGWTLQELIAPKTVHFFARDGHFLGDKGSLEDLIQDATGIPLQALRGAPLAYFPIDERLRWAASRETTRVEDKAYCLFGIFNVFLPPIYGEGDHAMARLREAIGKHGQHFDQSLLTQEPSSGTQAISNSLSRNVTQKNRQRKVTALAFDQMDARRTTIRDAQSSTCEWLLTHPVYSAWNKGTYVEHTHRIIWINGKPGVGKSTLIKYAFANASRTRPDNEVVVSFFFNARGDQLEKATEGMYRTLLHQLLGAMPDLQDVIDDTAFSTAEEEGGYSWSVERLQTAFTAVVGELKQRRVRCFIDALDECDEAQIRDMVDFFEDLVASHVGRDCRLLVCFASRHYPTIYIAHGRRLILENEAGHEEDMARYIRRHLRAGSSNVLKELHQQIQVKANGIFLWAILVVDILKRELERGRMFALRKQLENLQETLHKIPENLSDLFKDILRRDATDLDEFVLCLQWILFAKRPLRCQEFYFAMAVGTDAKSGAATELPHEPWDSEAITVDDMVRFISSVSKGFAELTKQEPSTVQFVHESLRDFLLREGGLAEIMSNRNLGSSAHEKLKICCENYLAADVSNLLVLEEFGQGSVLYEDDVRRHLLCQQYPFIEYAAKYLYDHAEAAAEHVAQTAFVKTFPLSRKLGVDQLLCAGDEQHSVTNKSLAYFLMETGRTRLLTELRQQQAHGEIPSEMLYNRDQPFGHAAIASYHYGHIECIRVLFHKRSFITNADIRNDPTFGDVGIPPRSRHDDPDWERQRKELLRGSDSLSNWCIRTGSLALATLEAQNESIPEPYDSGVRISAYAISNRRAEILQGWLDAGIGANATFSIRGHDLTLLSHAVVFDNIEAARLLLHRGADVNMASGLFDRTPLLHSARHGRYDIAELLLQKDHDIDCADKFGETPLILAAGHGNHQIVKLLLGAGAAVNTADNFGHTPLLLAAKNGDVAMVQSLLEGGAMLDAVDHSGRTALTFASLMRHEQVVKLLLESRGKS